jgi:hypothetical protein
MFSMAGWCCQQEQFQHDRKGSWSENGRIGAPLFPQLYYRSVIFFWIYGRMQYPCRIDGRPASRLNFKYKDFLSTASKTAKCGKRTSFSATLLPAVRCLCPRLIFFYGCNLPVGLTAGSKIEFKAQRFPLNCLKNGRRGTLLFPQPYYPERDVFAPD